MSPHQPPSPRPSGGFTALLGFVAFSAIAGVLIAVGVAPAIAVVGLGTRASIGAFDGLPEYLTVDRLAEPTVIYAKRDGQDVELARFYAQNREPLAEDKIPQLAKDTAVAAEDDRFFQHGGVDVPGTLRGAVRSLLTKNTSGGSSITQQYVKNVLLQKCEAMPQESKAELKAYNACVGDSTGITKERKLREIRYAIGIEKKYTKNQILAGYLNIAGFGGSVYGIQAAARYYFSLDAAALNPAQMASLLSIVNSPSNNKLDRPDSTTNGAKNGYAANKVRRDYILGKMLKAHKLSRADYKTALASPVEPHITPVERGCQTAGDAAFFCDYVQKVVLNDPAFGDDRDARAANFLRGGYRIHSTLDLGMQAVAQQAVASRIPGSSAQANLGGAAVGVQPGSGRVIFMAQSRSFSQDPDVLEQNPGTTAVNWSTDSDYGGSSGFQVGSTYKIFTLAEWLTESHSLYETVDANVRTYNLSRFTDTCGRPVGTWRPTNDAPGEEGRRSVLQATVQSINTAYVAMASKLDLCGIRNSAKAFGVHRADGEELSSLPSSVLGTNEIAPLTMATAFAGVANHGVVCTPIAIDHITRADGTELPAPTSTCTEAVSPQIAASMATALQRVISGGTAAASRVGDGVPILGKTGTTDNAEQIWLVESTTKVATAFWSGNVTGHVSMRSFSTGGMRADQVRHAVLKDIMRAANASFGGDTFDVPTRAADRLPIAPPTPTYTSAPNATTDPGEPTPDSATPVPARGDASTASPVPTTDR